MAQNNLALLETYLKDIIFTEEQITSTVDMRDHIFEIKDAEHSLGFISLIDLKAYVYEHEEEAKNYSVKNIDSSEWKNIYEHPFFQRRKPQLVSAETLKDADDLEFFILQKGQKAGPYEKYELMEKVENREILLSDMVSFNGGHNWIKLYQVDGFERRSLRDNDQLPGMPSSEFLKRASETTYNIGKTIDAMSSLAFLGNQKKGKSLDRLHEVSYKAEMDKGVSSTSIYTWLLIASVIGIIYFIFNIKSNLISPFGAQSNPIGEQAEMLRPVEENFSNNKSNTYPTNSRENDQRRRKFETRSVQPIRPNARKSFMQTNKFKDSMAEPTHTPAEDSNYYYDNAAPMELDPVRAQISKENFDNGGEPTPALEADPVEPVYSEEAPN